MNALTRFSAASALIILALGPVGCSKSEDAAQSADNAAKPAAAPESDTAASSTDAPAPEPETFADPDTAVNTLIAALRGADRPAFAKLFGIDADEFVPPADVSRADVEKFLAAYDAKHQILKPAADKASLAVGPEDWEFPVPLKETAGKWQFDVDAGRENIAVRRIGRNELDAIQTVLAYYDAQNEYASKDRNGDGILEYAQKVLSTEGQKDGLYWPGEGDDRSPLGPALDETATAGEPYHGYRYRILTAQGAHAPGGKRSYIIPGSKGVQRMTGGFGLIAWPAAYGKTGIMTFIVNHDGKVYQKDLGDDTETTASAITEYDPDNTWKEASPTS
jgi:hypothetical protein